MENTDIRYARVCKPHGHQGRGFVWTGLLDLGALHLQRLWLLVLGVSGVLAFLWLYAVWG
jgi:hypothetical protein